MSETNQPRYSLFRCSDATFLLCAGLLDLLTRLPLLWIDVTPASDFEWYFARATGIAQGIGYAQAGILTAFWPVGWPGFLGGLLWLFGPSVVVGQYANLVLSVIVVWLITLIGTRLFGDRRVGRLAALIITLLPNQNGYVPLRSAEIFFEFLLLLGFFLVLRESTAGLLMAGCVFGVSALTKSQAILLPAVIALPLLDVRGGHRGLGRMARTTLLMGIPMIIVVLPWTMRNHQVFDAWIPISTNGGITLLTGNNPSARGGFTAGDPLVTDLSVKPEDQVQADRTARERAVRWMVQNPVGFLKLIPLKVLRLWTGDGEAEWMYQRGYAGYDSHVVAFRAFRVLNQACYWLVLLLAAASSRPMLRRSRSLSPWCFTGWALFGYITAISIVFSGQSRFHFALMPFVALYASWRLMFRVSASGTANGP